MAIRISHPLQVSRYNSCYIYQWIFTTTHMPLIHSGTEFKNSLMDQVQQQLGIDRIFSAPYHPPSNGKLEVFHKYLKPSLKTLCEKDPWNWDKYLNQVLTRYRTTPNLAEAESPFVLVYGRDPYLPLHQLLEPKQCFLGDADSGKLNLEIHRLALAIAKKDTGWKRIYSYSKDSSKRQTSFSNWRSCLLQE